MKSNKTILYFTVLLFSFALIGGTMIACAQEHPEHPKEHPKEHPAEHPAEHPEAEKPEITKEALAMAIENYINKEAAESDGYYLFHDPKEKKDLSLKLERVHKERLSRISEDVYFACADFKSKDGIMYDLDFFMKGTSPDNLEFNEVYLHKKEGKERYIWIEEGGLWKREMVTE